MKIYLIGSLRNPEVTKVGQRLRDAGHEVFDDWMAAGEFADDAWRDYEKQERGHTFVEALAGEAARNVFEFDKKHLDSAEAAVLVMPAGKSAHIELGYMVGSGKKAYVLFDKEPDRYDVMYRFCTGVSYYIEGLIEALNAVS